MRTEAIAIMTSKNLVYRDVDVYHHHKFHFHPPGNSTSHERSKVPQECVVLIFPRAVIHMKKQLLLVGIVIPVVHE